MPKYLEYIEILDNWKSWIPKKSWIARNLGNLEILDTYKSWIPRNLG
jgi:hypothetical protein